MDQRKLILPAMLLGNGNPPRILQLRIYNLRGNCAEESLDTTEMIAVELQLLFGTASLCASGG